MYRYLIGLDLTVDPDQDSAQGAHSSNPSRRACESERERERKRSRGTVVPATFTSNLICVTDLDKFASYVSRHTSLWIVSFCVFDRLIGKIDERGSARGPSGAIGQCKRRERPSVGEHPWGCVQFRSRSPEIPTRSSGGRRRHSCSPLSHGRPYLLRAGPRPPPAHRQPRPSQPRSTFCARPCPSISRTCPPSPQTRRARRRRPALCAELEFQRARL